MFSRFDCYELGGAQNFFGFWEGKYANGGRACRGDLPEQRAIRLSYIGTALTGFLLIKSVITL